MRTERWQAMGAPSDQGPAEEDIIAAEADEDAEAATDSPTESFGPSLREVHDPDSNTRSEPAVDNTDEIPSDHTDVPPFDVPASVEPVRPFENLPVLPRDLADAFENFKLAILNHKLSGWRDVSAEDVLTVLNSLKELALAPS